ncbi:MAG: dTMP kinase [Patescibacteria group bacterium]
MEKNYSGKFIVFEGLDGSGQSTQAALLKKELEEKNIPALLTKEPTDRPPIGTLVRQILKKEIVVNPQTLQFLFCADRGEHLEKEITPALEKGNWVISDRYFYSTLAYGALDLDFNWLLKLNEKFLKPDIVFLLKTTPKTSLKRIDCRGQREFFEQEQKLEKVWQNYERISKITPEIKIIDGEKSIAEVFEQIKFYMDEIK